MNRKVLMTPEYLWGKVKVCFEIDDGSLPTIEIRDLGSSDVARIYSLIRDESRLVSKHSYFWDTNLKLERHLDDVKNAAELVTENGAEPFHFNVENLTSNGVTLPCLGVHVFQDSIAIDYRMGKSWNLQKVYAFFSWLKEIVELAGGASVVPASSEGPPCPDVFIKAWMEFEIVN